ncbi:unnamed protein product [Scytosiphon promiscuus]
MANLAALVTRRPPRRLLFGRLLALAPTRARRTSRTARAMYFHNLPRLRQINHFSQNEIRVRFPPSHERQFMANVILKRWRRNAVHYSTRNGLGRAREIILAGPAQGVHTGVFAKIALRCGANMHHAILDASTGRLHS